MPHRAEMGQEQTGLAQSAFDALPTQIAVLDADGVILWTNDAWQRFGAENGLQDPSTLGCNYLDVCDRTDDEDARAVADGLRRLLAAERDVFRYEYPCHDVGGEQRWFQLRALTFDEGTNLLVAHYDITERKLAELELREYADELELLTGILAHDIRNPLNAAQMRADLIDGDDAGHLDALVSSLDRIDAMIDDALVLASDKEPTNVEPVDLGTSVETAWDNVGTETATVTTGDLPVIDADAQLLLQLFENLFRNAVEHGGPDVTIRVEPLATADDGTTGFAVTDDGPGIDPADRETVFETGYTTAPETGTGYGLAIVRKVASAHGWTVEAVESESGGVPASEASGDSADEHRKSAGARFEITGIAN